MRATGLVSDENSDTPEVPIAGWFPRKSIAAKYRDLMPSRSGARTSSEIRLLRGLVKNWLFAPPYRIAMQHRTTADDFRKALRIVPDEIDFGEASQFDL